MIWLIAEKLYLWIALENFPFDNIPHADNKFEKKLWNTVNFCLKIIQIIYFGKNNFTMMSDEKNGAFSNWINIITNLMTLWDNFFQAPSSGTHNNSALLSAIIAWNIFILLTPSLYNVLLNFFWWSSCDGPPFDVFFHWVLFLGWPKIAINCEGSNKRSTSYGTHWSWIATISLTLRMGYNPQGIPSISQFASLSL